jgi:hypothetical protein
MCLECALFAVAFRHMFMNVDLLRFVADCSFQLFILLNNPAKARIPCTIWFQVIRTYDTFSFHTIHTFLDMSWVTFFYTAKCKHNVP